jgi:hypothetical protein
MWWRDKKERSEEREERMAAKLVEAIGQAFGATLQAQATVMKQNSDFLTALQEISARKAAQIMGQRGGRRTQERKRLRLAGPQQQCALCVEPNRRDVTVEMVHAHNQHLATEQAQPQESHANGNGV